MSLQPVCATAAGLRMLLRAALPQACMLCAGDAGVALLCADCERWLPRIDHACPRCGLPTTSGARGFCGACLVRPPAFAATRAALAYAFPVDRLLHRLKYGGALAVADWAASAWVSHCAGEVCADVTGSAWPDVLTPVPLAVARQRERGFNQALEIARGLAQRLGIPLRLLLERSRAAPPQAQLPWGARLDNVRGAFRCVRPLSGEHVAIVDDVMTTGATVHDAARALRDGGAGVVSVWVVARTLRREDG